MRGGIDPLTYRQRFARLKWSQPPGPISVGERHPGHDEWWIVLEGQTDWVVEGIGAISARKNEFVCVPSGRLHQNHSVGTRPSLRLVVVTPEVQYLPPSASDPASCAQ